MQQHQQEQQDVHHKHQHHHQHHQQQVRQLQACVPGFDTSAYSTAQLAVPASDGCLVPLSLAWNSQQLQQPALKYLQQISYLQPGSTQPQQPQQQQQAAPMLLTCYGSYGIKEPVGFSPELLQLLDAGWVVGVAHVRGGGCLGRAWADAGRGLGKPHSIQDLKDVAAYVQQVGSCDHIAVALGAEYHWEQGIILMIVSRPGDSQCGFGEVLLYVSGGKCSQLVLVPHAASVSQLCLWLLPCQCPQVGLCAPGQLCLSGSSAGGWLAAAAALQAPHLFRSLVLTVPCLDPLGLMLSQQQGQVELGDAVGDAQVRCGMMQVTFFTCSKH
jgi:hypothetical protein